MGLPHDDGASSPTAWLADLTGISKGEAAKLVGLARVTTAGTEATRAAAWASGQISTDQAAVIMKAIDALPDWCGDTERGDAEAHLIALAAEHPLDDLKRLANRVLEVIDPDGADEVVGEQLRAEERRAWEATRMSLKRRGDGTTRGAFTIPDADADTLRAAIEGIIAPRRAKATADRLDLDLDGTATNTSGTTMSAAKARRLACNAHLVALYLDSESRVIDHGMTRRLFDKHQRLILAVRDGGCVFPGCQRPPAWCEAHHIDFWSEGGPTDLDNAALL